MKKCISNYGWKIAVNIKFYFVYKGNIQWKYLIMKSYEKEKLIIREFGDLDKHMFSILCE